MAAFLISGIKFTARHPDTDKPLSFGKVYTYDTGTTSTRVTYKTEDKLQVNTNPVILDANGQADICLDGKYRIVLADENDAMIEITDPVQDVTSQIRDAIIDTSILGTASMYDVGTEYGQVMLIGDGTSLGKSENYPTIINPDPDLNNMPLKWKIWHGNGGSLLNAPSTNQIVIMQIPNNNGTIMQIVYDMVNGEEYRRMYDGFVWGTWKPNSGIGTLADFNSSMGA